MPDPYRSAPAAAQERPKAVRLAGVLVRPLPGEMASKVVCVNCRGNPARWELGAVGQTKLTFWNYACSFCFIYELPVMAAQRASVEWLIHETEKVKGVVFRRYQDGRLVEERDADAIAFAVVATNKVMSLRAKADK